MSETETATQTEDSLLGGRVRIAQPPDGYRAAIDPVLLAAATAAEPGERVLDVGAGTGAASLCLATRVPGCRVVGLELHAEVAAYASHNIELNGLPGRTWVVVGDRAKIEAGVRELNLGEVMFLDADGKPI